MEHQVHFEVFARRPGATAFVLDCATEDRARALEAAEELIDCGRATAVRVTKEMLDSDSGEYKSLTIFTKGAPDRVKTAATVEDAGPLCVAPTDLYTGHARDRIGRLLEDWLSRRKATPFELLHRADLIEKLEASGVELQHAIQKIAVPEAQGRAVGVHEVIRHYQGLTERAMERVLKDSRKGLFPDLASEEFGAVCEKLAGDPERFYRLGGAVAGYLADAEGWSAKVERLLDLADAAPAGPQARGLAFQILEQPLGEILGSRLGLAELLGPGLDLGGELASLTRLAAAEAAEVMLRADAGMHRLLPELVGPAARLAKWLDGPNFESVRSAIAQRVLRELTSGRRLRPADARGEIDILRALGMALSAASGRLLPIDDVREAFTQRSTMLVAGDFVDVLLGSEKGAIEETRDLIWLMENVIGAANKRAAARWLTATLTSLRFEKELRSGPNTASGRLATLAELQRQARRVAGDIAEGPKIQARLGEVGGFVEADGKVVAQISRADAPLVQRLNLLTHLATGEGAPAGPAAEKARFEAIKLLRTPQLQQEMARTPELAGLAKTLIGLKAA